MTKSSESDILAAIYAISKTASRSCELKTVFDEMSTILKKVLDFNYFLIHQLNSQEQAHVIYAKSIGSVDPQDEQFTWESLLSNIVINTENAVIQQSGVSQIDGKSQDTLHFLGVPLVCGKKCRGSIAFIRLGDPPFTQDDVDLTEFSALVISIIIERDIMRLEEELIASQRAQARIQEDFISQITHDLRNPLGVIKGYTTTLLRPEVKWSLETTNEFLKIIDQESDRLQAMIDNLLESARIQAGQLDMEFQITHVESIIDNVVSKAASQYPNIKINIEKENDLNPIYGDPHRLTQVFENLISNVDKHAPNSSIWIKICNNGQGLRIEFIDDGPGIPAEYIPKLFTRFFRAPSNAPNVHGSGLGLYICKQIIENHRGSILAVSSKDQGTTIKIELPG